VGALRAPPPTARGKRPRSSLTWRESAICYFSTFTPNEEHPNSTRTAHLVTAHSFFLVLELKPRLKIAAISEEWIRSRGKTDAGAGMRHEIVGDDVVLTGSTEELQALLKQAARDAKAFPSVDELIRLR
jgi:hypothetical protein